jgi:hypothetical protein
MRGLGCYEVPGSATRVGWSESATRVGWSESGGRTRLPGSGGRTRVNRLGPNDFVWALVN